MAKVKQVDRISKLPDALLCDILSYLSTKEAVATSILSKRWESVWTQVPLINITMDYGNSSKGFKAFVDRVLICNDSPSLRLFQLDCLKSDVNVPRHQYHSWIRNIMQRDVAEIDLSLHNQDTLPAGTFSSEKLMVLKLTGLDSPLQNPIHIPNLFTLHFKNITFTDDFSLNDILMSLPRLGELVVKNCSGVPNIIRSYSLKRLYLVQNHILSEDNENTTIAAPSLEYLCIDDVFLSSDYKFGNIRRYPFMVKALKKILLRGSNLVTLELVVSTMEAVPGDNEHDQLPLFPHLKRFIITGHYCSVNCLNFSWRYLVLSSLQRAPNLVSLDYSVTHDPFNMW